MFKSMIIAMQFAAFGLNPIQITDRYIGSGFIRYKHFLNIVNKRQMIPTKDDVMYNPNTGEIIIGLTNHPQKSGRNGEFITPGDCWEVINSNVLHAQVLLDSNVITLYRASDGFERRIEITIMVMPGCDTTTAF